MTSAVALLPGCRQLCWAVSVTLLSWPLLDDLLAGLTRQPAPAAAGGGPDGGGGGGRFAPGAYHILTNNCNHFTHELAGVLTGGGLPAMQQLLGLGLGLDEEALQAQTF
eukprot:XP_001697950.1 predicted protein [Chlamydomonas reinhardtii]